MGMNRLETVESVALYSNALMDEKIRRAANAQVVRTQTVLHNGGQIAEGQTITLLDSVENYDAIMLVVGAAGSFDVNRLANTITQEYSVEDWKKGDATLYPIVLSSQTIMSVTVKFQYKTATTFSVRKIDKSSNAEATVGIHKIYGIRYTAKEVYSTDEQIVGTWIDGKPLYQKTYNFGALPNNGSKTLAHGLASGYFIVDMRGVAYNPSTKEHFPIPFANLNGVGVVRLNVEQNNISISTTVDRSDFTKVYVTLQYTKS